MNALEPGGAYLCAEVLDPLVGADRLDFVGDLGARMPMRVIGALLGIPVQDQEDVRQHKDDTLRRARPARGVQRGSVRRRRVLRRVHRLAHRQPVRRPDDVRSSEAEFEDETGTVRCLTHDELLIFVNVLATAGNETTNRVIGHIGRLLAEHPDQRRELVDDRSLIPNAVEEILRAEPPALQACRYVTRDVEFHGQTVPEGSTLMVLMASANRDDRAFPPDGDVFDIHREIGHHLTFGHGIHFCLGAAPRPARSAGRHRRDPQPVPRVGGRLGQRPPRQLAGARLGVPARAPALDLKDRRGMPPYIVLDTQDPEPLIDFYCKLQGIEVLLTLRDGQWTALTANREGLMLVLQQVPEAKSGKNRAHFDVVVDDLDDATMQVEEPRRPVDRTRQDPRARGFQLALHGRSRGQRVLPLPDGSGHEQRRTAASLTEARREPAVTLRTWRGRRSIASTMRAGVSGRRVRVTPSGASAPLTALTTAGGAPMAPPSPTPL